MNSDSHPPPPASPRLQPVMRMSLRSELAKLVEVSVFAQKLRRDKSVFDFGTCTTARQDGVTRRVNGFKLVNYIRVICAICG